jgi:hypothetical protein
MVAAISLLRLLERRDLIERAAERTDRATVRVTAQRAPDRLRFGAVLDRKRESNRPSLMRW